jgi:hypothetical protein
VMYSGPAFGSSSSIRPLAHDMGYAYPDENRLAACSTGSGSSGMPGSPPLSVIGKYLSPGSRDGALRGAPVLREPQSGPTLQYTELGLSVSTSLIPGKHRTAEHSP